MDIRKPDEIEMEQIFELSPQAIIEGTLGEVEPTIEKARKLVEPIIKKGGYYLIATENGKLMGWILLGGSKDHFLDKQVGFIYELFVLEDYRGKGIAKQLIKTGIEQLKEDGYSEVRLTVFDGNPAIHIYESLGFKNRTISMSIT
ncbi:GNAT family N-acetyltransferase [Ornithinibacillus halotolerans]|uniref:N-acetyltransferase n=1 Tax=Ornithinibacillus halotolerans TaxID=1274357 RepID=A0A916S930_9BACI|nr:GNAT family N-acetyltransferase [Ornithinibacillus halotolerans]GGA90010.1 N-acetyltransferase [Ornithinibacillus halotolerans]